jgi:AcrR family transcriptional regulator
MYSFQMESNLDTVKTHYHHGDLRKVLIDTAVAVLADRGVDGFSLRETARRAGVSPGAPKHHFADTRALLTAIATDAFDQLHERLETAANEGTTRFERLAAQAQAYVVFALDHPAHFDLMWRSALLDQTNIAYVEAGDRAFRSLDRLLRGDDAQPAPRTDPVMIPTIACWSLVHGLARLALDGALGPLDNVSREAVFNLASTVVPQMASAVVSVVPTEAQE